MNEKPLEHCMLYVHRLLRTWTFHESMSCVQEASCCLLLPKTRKQRAITVAAFGAPLYEL